jgi:arginase
MKGEKRDVPIAVLDAPSVLGLHPTGVERLADALRNAGIVGGLHARDAGRLHAPAHDSLRDPQTGVMNARAIAAYSKALADRAGRILNRGEFPVILGGDCSILLGPLLALRRRGRAGLLFVDGHADFYQPEAEPTGEAASMELAFATGRGPRVVADIEGRKPLVRDADVVIFGQRDAEQARRFGSQPTPRNIRRYTHATVKRLGAATAARRAVGYLSRAPREGFWIHFDVDVLDDRVMPAVDYRMPGGLTWREAETVLTIAVTSGLALGMTVTIFNPRLDRRGTIAGRLARSIVNGLRPAR